MTLPDLPRGASSQEGPTQSTILNMNDNPLAQLPQELLQATLNFLDRPALLGLALSCRWGYHVAMPYLWSHVELVDCRENHPDMPYSSDEHDDSPIIKILMVLATYVLFPPSLFLL